MPFQANQTNSPVGDQSLFTPANKGNLILFLLYVCIKEFDCVAMFIAINGKVR